MKPRAHTRDFSLYAPDGGRKYLNRAERSRALAVMQTLPIERALFALTLAWTGARVSEVLALTPASFQIKAGFQIETGLEIETGIVALRTLKRRQPVVREVPIPPELMNALDRHFAISHAQLHGDAAHRRLWKFHRTTAWRMVKHVMRRSRIAGAQACPKGLRHAFGLGVLQAGVPVTQAKKWLGHSRLTTTEIYLMACGPEDLMFAARFWRANNNWAPARELLTRERR
jgi:integrase